MRGDNRNFRRQLQPSGAQGAPLPSPGVRTWSAVHRVPLVHRFTVAEKTTDIVVESAFP
jgi:hypothetical protein